MGPCKTLNPVIFTFINASDLKFCVRFYSSMMRFEWKSLQNAWPQLAGGQGGQLPPPDEPDHHQIEACGLRMGRPSFIFQSIFSKFRVAPSALAPLPPQAKNASYGPEMMMSHLNSITRRQRVRSITLSFSCPSSKVVKKVDFHMIGKYNKARVSF